MQVHWWRSWLRENVCFRPEFWCWGRCAGWWWSSPLAWQGRARPDCAATPPPTAASSAPTSPGSTSSPGLRSPTQTSVICRSWTARFAVLGLSWDGNSDLLFVDKMSQPAQSGQVFQPETDLSGVESPQVSLLPQPQGQTQEGNSPAQVRYILLNTQPFESVIKVTLHSLRAKYKRNIKSNAIFTSKIKMYFSLLKNIFSSNYFHVRWLRSERNLTTVNLLLFSGLWRCWTSHTTPWSDWTKRSAAWGAWRWSTCLTTILLRKNILPPWS